MGSEISLFSKKSFIEASKKFVCVRLESYESKEHQSMMRKLLWGTFQNTAFVVFAPDGKTALTRSGRSPRFAYGRNVESGMLNTATKYKAKDLDKTVVQDFHSFKQSLNVASADQRLLVFTVLKDKNNQQASETLSTVFNDKAISGRFHFDRAGKSDTNWSKSITNKTQTYGTFIIQSDTYGQKGKIVAELPLGVTAEKLKATLLTENAKFAKTEKRKNYSTHIATGRRLRIKFENTVPHGEDRDGDGKIDQRLPRRGRR